MRYKVKTKDCHLIVKAKTSWGETIDEKALDSFARISLRGFLKPKVIKSNMAEYDGPVGITLYERLKRPMGKRDFLFIMEQIVVAAQKIQANQLSMNKVILDLHNVFINDVTKEIQFLYVPITKDLDNPGLIPFIESIVYSTTPTADQDADFVSRFVYFIKAQRSFDPDAIERYIEKEDATVVRTIKKQNMKQSGFMTSSRKHYHDHYDEKKQTPSGVEKEVSGEEYDADGTDLLTNQPYYGSHAGTRGQAGWRQAGNGVIHQNNPQDETDLLDQFDSKGGNFQHDPYDETGLLDQFDSKGGNFQHDPYDETGLLDQFDSKGGNFQHDPYDETGLLDQFDSKGGSFQHDPYDETGLLDQFNGTGENHQSNGSGTGFPGYGSTGNDVRNNGFFNGMPEEDEEEGTALLNESWSVHYPTLFRVRTQERITIDKPVFRIGKERSYVDYFVTNNNAVSRSHADIVTRGSRYFVVDMNSKNHTYINDRMIQAHCETEIRDGDRLRLGNEEFVFQI